MKYRIEHDQDCEKPNLMCEVAYWITSRYVMGNNPLPGAELIKIGKKIESGKLIGLPVRAYVHSGQIMTACPIKSSQYPFTCQWDAGNSGFAYISKEKAKEWLGQNRLTAKSIAKIKEMMISEVETLSQWLNGDCFGFVIEDENGNKLDSCWGYIGHDFCEESAKEAMKHLEENAA